MSWIETLERRLGRFAIPGLIRVLVGFQALVFVLLRVNPEFYTTINLDRAAILNGELWRLVTFIMVPDTNSLLWIIFALYFLWLVGEGLEQAWGSFKVNLYVLLGALSAIVSACVFGVALNNMLFNFSLLFAFSTIYPAFQVLAYLILPIKIKWLAFLSLGFVLWMIVTGDLAVRMAVIFSFANYLLFFTGHWISHWKQSGEIAARRTRFEIAKIGDDDCLHRCKTCGRTEQSDPTLDFRVSSDGEEYCADHLPSRNP